MKISINKLFVLVFILPLATFSQVEAIFNGITLKNSTEQVMQKLSPISETVNLISPKSVRFPIAKNTESHIICTNIKTNNVIIEKAIFTFADNKLSYIEARGNVIEVFESNRQDTARTYLDYKAYVKDKLFLNEKKDIAWILNNEGMHLNLFTWENPYFNDDYKVKIDLSGKIPEFINMGATIDALKPTLEANSAFTNTEKLDGSDPNAQIQINCFGVNYFGFPRKIEARFGDNQLNTVWILTAKGEEDRIRQELIKHYGKPIFVNEAWEIFDNWKIGLRKDKPEVLLLTQELGLFYKKDFFKQ
ncbi:hypothetical protein [Pontimicrobium aquaticum]|uniref:Uncharacterized protein n=1 Tax=Pontimicrobium aquaticum TaxID=2565367 RepID=A0A4U0EW65_9FLAO|nr:hypothetical protein [Pontimicrobium aquaticum]TJY36201.1 hypothetical protein E5167_05910 [Pontimicrobium aquaticum]